MIGPTHALIGLFSIAIAARVTGDAPSAVGVLCGVIGSLAPDIDGDGSICRPGWLVRPLVGWRLAKFVDRLGSALSIAVRRVFRHRGFFHVPLLPLFGIVAATHWQNAYLFWFSIGYLSHILADFLTYLGVPLLFPIRLRYYSASMLATGSIRELLLALLLLPTTILLAWPLLPSGIRHTYELWWNHLVMR